MPPELSAWAGGIAAVVGVVAAVVYLRAIFGGRTRPNRATWWILAVVGMLIAASYYSAGARHTLWLALIYALIPLSVAIVSVKHGEGGCGRFDLACLLAAGISVVLWCLSQTAVITLLINLMIDFVGLLPTIRKSYLRPENENRAAWTLALVASVMSLFAVEQWKFAIAVYPLYLTAGNGLIVGILWFRSVRQSNAVRLRDVLRLILVGIGIDILLSHQSAAGEANRPLEQKDAFDPPKNSWSSDSGFNFVGAYYAFGLLCENEGVIAQPYFDLYYLVYEGDKSVKITLGLQLWSSIHSKGTGADPENGALAAWYEQDVVVPLSVTLADKFSGTLSYLEYHFPNGALESKRAASLTFSYDDSSLLGVFALHPHLTALYNFEDVIGIDKSDAWYFEAGIAPEVTLAKKSRYPVTISLPVTAGFGDDHFYPGDPFGYFSAGANAAVPLAFFPESFGRWTVNAGGTYQIFGNATAAFNSKRSATVGQIGLKWDF